MREAPRSSPAARWKTSNGFPQQRPVDRLLFGVDVGLFAAIFVLPFVMGGRQAIGEFALTVIACWTAVMWLLRQTVRGDSDWRLTAMAPLLLIGIGLGTLQCITLPAQIVNRLSPETAKVLPAWSDEATRQMLGGPWSTLSLIPYETQRSLVCIVACAILFIVAVNRLRSLDDVRRLIRALAVAMTLMALFGCVQYVLGNGRFFWVYDHPFTNTRDYAKGAFTNPNHFADYVAMALPLLLAWYAVHTLSGGRTERGRGRGRGHELEGVVIVGCLGCVAIALLLSQSRGGLLAACVGVMVALLFLHRVRALTGRTAGMIGGIACMALLSLTLFGDRIVALVDANFHELASADVSQLDRGSSRRKIWQAAIAGIHDYPLLGTGLSSHHEVYWTYFDHPDDGTEYSHAENGYLQLALEAGLAGAATAGGCLLVLVWWCLRGIRQSRSVEAGALLAAILGVIAVNLAHSVTDFIWYAPSIMVVVVLLAACAAALRRESSAQGKRGAPPAEPSPPGFRPGWGLAFAGMVLLSGWMMQVKLPAVVAEPYWFDYIRLVQTEDRPREDVDIAAHRRQKYTALLSAARADRCDARMQLQAARAYQSLFELQQRRAENPMSLLQIQDAALASEWSSPEELAGWLNRPGVLGENRKYLDAGWKRALHALRLCPLQAEGYLMLGELSWIYSTPLDTERTLLAQALRARAYDAEVHYILGRVSSLRGNEPAALEHWKESFHRSERFREQITELLAPVWPAEQFVRQFEPDTEALVSVVETYRTSPDQQGYRRIAAELADRLSQQAAGQRLTDAARTWRQAFDLYVELGDVDEADRTAQAAVDADPNNFQARRNLGKWLFGRENYAAAIEHLQWCLRRSPTDREVDGWLHAAVARDHASQLRVAAPASAAGRRL